jgi:hypothetical protein
MGSRDVVGSNSFVQGGTIISVRLEDDFPTFEVLRERYSHGAESVEERLPFDIDVEIDEGQYCEQWNDVLPLGEFLDGVDDIFFLLGGWILGLGLRWLWLFFQWLCERGVFLLVVGGVLSGQGLELLRAHAVQLYNYGEICNQKKGFNCLGRNCC